MCNCLCVCALTMRAQIRELRHRVTEGLVILNRDHDTRPRNSPPDILPNIFPKKNCHAPKKKPRAFTPKISFSRTFPKHFPHKSINPTKNFLLRNFQTLENSPHIACDKLTPNSLFSPPPHPENCFPKCVKVHGLVFMPYRL